MITRFLRLPLLASVAVLLLASLLAQQAPNKKQQKKADKPKKAQNEKQREAALAADEKAAKATFLASVASIDEKLQRDFPDLCFDKGGMPWVCYIENDGKADVLHLGRVVDGKIDRAAVISTPGVLHHPALACDGAGGLWCLWGQVDDRNIMTLRARCFADGKLGEESTLARSDGSDTFADAGTDKAGHVWVAWQSMRRGQGDIMARWYDPAKHTWSGELSVSKPEGGNWEPRLAFDDKEGAWIAYDSSRSGDFNLYLARVSPDGTVKEKQLTDSSEYEARAAVAWDRKGGLWIVGERGRRQWGMQQRGHETDTGFNGHKRLIVGRYDIAKDSFTELPVYDNGRPAPIPMPSPGFNVNVPSVNVDDKGNPWIAYRVCNSINWRVALLKYDAAKGQWNEPVEVPSSTMGQDRRNELTRAADGSLWLCWPSDRRVMKDCGISGVYVAKVDTEAALALVPKDDALTVNHLPDPEPYMIEPPKDRPREEHHVWKIGGKTYRLVFGDLHRHTDISNCRTGGDGCIVEHFRYAYDMAALDFMGTSDHTDVGKKMDPYEWWHTQRMVDVFYAPGKFNSLYAYEREQSYPWGHRNVIFAQRGGPVVYIKRALYKDSPWQEALPVNSGLMEITPQELWDVLDRYGKPVALISHTGATGMGTDWDKYDGNIDYRLENTVEIYQGARVSYEGRGTPQPTTGLRVGQKYTADTASKAEIPAPPAAIEDFGEQRNNGLYQHALADGFKLGVFADSDHISQHCSFGGVYVEDFTREGIIEAFRARRSIAATCKIFVEFGASGHPMGTIFESKENPQLQFAVDGMAPLKRLTIVRNETDWKVIEPKGGEMKMESSVTDDAPNDGDNRYYLRVEQTDGSMAWSSPVWVTVHK